MFLKQVKNLSQQFQQYGKKLKLSRGETLAETLVAVLIISLASVTLAVMIGAASRMNIRAKKYDKQLDEALITMSESSSGGNGTVVLEVKGSTEPKIGIEFPVKIKKSTGTLKLASYEYLQPTQSSDTSLGTP